MVRYAMQESARLHGWMIAGSLSKVLQLSAFQGLELRESRLGLGLEVKGFSKAEDPFRGVQG